MSTPLVDVVRLGPATKIRLTTLKRRTGINNWNVLCRWAFCLSVSAPEPVGERHPDQGTGVEMTWKTFAGDHELLYQALLESRVQQDGVCDLGELIRLHISRGLARLLSTKDIDSISGLLNFAEQRANARTVK